MRPPLLPCWVLRLRVQPVGDAGSTHGVGAVSLVRVLRLLLHPYPVYRPAFWLTDYLIATACKAAYAAGAGQCKCRGRRCFGPVLTADVRRRLRKVKYDVQQENLAAQANAANAQAASATRVSRHS